MAGCVMIENPSHLEKKAFVENEAFMNYPDIKRHVV